MTSIQHAPLKSQLTFKGLVKEVPVHSTDGFTQIVGSLQSIVAVVVVCWVFKGKAALYVVLINIHIRPYILSVGNFLIRE